MATTTGFKIQCPSCEAQVSIKNESLVGKKVDCPKCKYRFVVQAPSDGEDDEEGATLKKSKGGGTAVAKKAPARSKVKDDDGDEAPPKKKSNMILFVGIGIAVLAVGVIIGAIFLLGDDEPPKSGGGGGGAVAKGSGTTGGSSASTPQPKNDPGAPAPVAGTPGLVRDATNLLPNDVQWVLDVDAPKALQTPGGAAIFSPAKGTAALVKDYLGVAVNEIDRIVASGGGYGAWTFTVIKTRSAINLETVKTAMELTDPAGNIKNRDYYVAKDNALFIAVGEYFKTKLEERKFKLDPPPGPREMTVSVLDSKTMVVADRHVMVKFLEDDAQPAYRSKLTTAPPPAAGPGVGGPPGVGPPGGQPQGPPGGLVPLPPPGKPMSAPANPLQGPPPRPIGPGGPGGAPPPIGPGMPGQSQPAAPRVYTSVPSFRTINPALKSMLNQMEGEEKPIFNFATRVEASRIMDMFFGGGLSLSGNKFKPSLPPGKGKEGIPKAPYIGITLYAFSVEKLDLRCGVESEDEEQAKEVESLLRSFLPLIALVVADEAGIPVKERRRGNNNGTPGDSGFGPGVPPPGVGVPPGPGMPPMPGPGMPPPAPGKPGGGATPGRADGKDKGEHIPFQGPPPRPSPPGGPGPGGPPPPPVGPGGPGMPPIGPGGPSIPGYPGQKDPKDQKPESTVGVDRLDKVVTISINLEWKEEYQNVISPPLNDYFDGVAGLGMLLAAKEPWQKLSVAVKRLQSSGKFPRAAASRRSVAARMGLPFAPEQRVSWVVELLPGLNYETLYRQIDKDASWNSPINLRAGRAWVAEFLDPAQDPDSWRANLTSVAGRDLGATHFVGLSGIGDDAADLPDKPEYASRLGVFGYERETSVADISDGLDKTIFLIQVRTNIARPWIRGGGATVQGVSPARSFEPFNVKQANLDYGAYAIMCDGTVRFVKTGIPDELFKAMTTFKAKDNTAGIDEWAPKVEMTTSRLRKGPAIAPKLPEVPPSYVPKGWEGLSVRVLGASFAVALPPGPTDVAAEQPWEKTFTGKWTSKNLTLGVSARHIFGLPATDPNGDAALSEVNHYIDMLTLHQEGSITDAPNLGPSKGKQFRAKPTKDFKGTTLYRVWVVNGARLVLSATGPADLKDGDADEFFKSASAQPGVAMGGAHVPADPKGWAFYYNPALRFVIGFPGKYEVIGTEQKINLYYPKGALGGALFTFTLNDAKLDPAVDVAKGYASLEKAVKEGQFGKNPRNITKKMIDDRPGVHYLLREGDTVYSTWAVYNNEESAVVLRVRKDAGMPPAAETIFFASLRFNVDKPPEKKGNAGVGPGVPPTGPGLPPGGGPPPPPGLPGPPK